jgi:hypothetical protein
MAVRLEPVDEYTHRPGAEASFNESMYFNVFDPAAGVGGFFRVGNRVNEGMAEVTVCLYLGDGRVGFSFGRPRIATNDAFDAGGLRFDVVTPFEELTVTYEGSVTLLDDPLEMVDPRAAFTSNPRASCSVALRYTRVSDMFGGESDRPETPGQEFAKAHYEQLVAASGTVAVDGVGSWTIDGFGLRDHSWGPRSWQAPWYYRWLTGNAGPDFGFMASRVASATGPGTRGGFVWEDGTLHLCDRATLSTAWTDEGSYHRSVEFSLSGGDRSWSGKGEVLSLVPLRNRRDDKITRISEGMTRWTMADGRVGYGLSEYLDQMIDGHPVGLAE